MNEVERADVARRFLSALSGNQLLLKRWLSTDRHDAAAVGTLVAQTLGLKDIPTREDLLAMAAETSRVIAMRLSTAQHDDNSHAVGIFFVVQHAETMPSAVGVFFAVQQAEAASVPEAATKVA